MGAKKSTPSTLSHLIPGSPLGPLPPRREIFNYEAKFARKNTPKESFGIYSDTVRALDLVSPRVTEYEVKEWKKLERNIYVFNLCHRLRGDESLRLLEALNVLDLGFKSAKLPYYYHRSRIKCRLKKSQEICNDKFVRMMYHKIKTAVQQEERSILFSRLLALFKKATERLKSDCYKFSRFNAFLTILRENVPTEDSHFVIECVLGFMKSSTLLSDSFRYIRDDANLEFLLHHAMREGIDYYSLWVGVGSGFEDVYSQYTLKNGFGRFDDPGILKFNRPQFLPILLTYGFRFKFMRVSGAIMYVVLNKLGSSGDSKFLLKESRSERRLWTRWEMTRLTHYESMAIYIFTIMMEDSWETKIKILRLIMRSDPYPYVTSEEMYSIMTRFVVPKYLPEVWQTCLDYEGANVYDEDYSVYLPRRLLHLARCAIRERLAENRQLPVGVEELGLPRDMKDYLYLIK